LTVKEAIETRRSIRKYDSRPVEEEKLLSVMEAGRLSPSAANGQNWRFILVRDPEKLKQLHAASDNQPSVAEAPACIVAVATSTRTMDCGQETGAMDASIAMTQMLLAAHELGLGTCWLGHFFAPQVKTALSIPDSAEVIAFTPIGYPAETPDARPRKAFSEVLSFDGF
jgi:nitroreductase